MPARIVSLPLPTQSTYNNTMPASLFDADFQTIIDAAKRAAGQANAPFPSPPDWRDQWIYFLMVDRFNNKAVPPHHQPFDDSGFSDFQGGKFSGVMDKLPYLKKLGVGAIWLSPVLKNLQFDPIYHGYGIHDFVRAEPRFADDPQNAVESFNSALKLFPDWITAETNLGLAWQRLDKHAEAVAAYKAALARNRNQPDVWLSLGDGLL